MLNTLTSRQKEVVVRLFGIGQKKETLQSIADTQDCTRERIRQVKVESLRKLRKVIGLYSEAQKIKKEIMTEVKIFGFAKESDIAFDGFRLLILHLTDLEKSRLDRKIYHTTWKLSSIADMHIQRVVNIQVQNLIDGMCSVDCVSIKKGVFVLNDVYFYRPYMKSLGDKAKFILGNKTMRVRDILKEVCNFFYKDKKKPTRNSVNNMLILDPRFILVEKGKYKLNKKYDSKTISSKKATGRKTYIK